MNSIIIRNNDLVYDKEIKYKSEKIKCVSKDKMKSLECEEKIQGFFYMRKAKTNCNIKIKDFSFDFKNTKPRFSYVKGYVKDYDNKYYAILSLNFLPLLLIPILLCLILSPFFNTSDTTVEHEWNPIIEQTEEVEETTTTKSGQITICGFSEWTVQAGETEDLPISLKNSDKNSCYLKFSIKLENGIPLYESNYVKPNSEIKKIDINTPLEKGEYTAYILIEAYEIETGRQMNSAKTKITIKSI